MHLNQKFNGKVNHGRGKQDLNQNMQQDAEVSDFSIP